MIPLYFQLENRYHDLEQIRESLWNLEGEVLTDQMIGQLPIDFHHLDIDTGATSDPVTPYFLPRASFPSCREMTGEMKDTMLGAGQDGHRKGFHRNTWLFPANLYLALRCYACEMNKDLDRRFIRKE